MVPRSSPVGITLYLSDHTQSHGHASVASVAGNGVIIIPTQYQERKEGGMVKGQRPTSGAEETEMSGTDEVTTVVECLVVG